MKIDSKLITVIFFIILCTSIFSAKLFAFDLKYRIVWLLEDQHAGELYALDKGMYDKVGINLIIQPFKENEKDPYEAILIGEADIGIYETFTLLRRAVKDNADIVIFALKEQLDPSGYMSLESKNIKEPKQLEGKIYGYYNEGDMQLLRWYAELNNIDFNSIKLKKILPNDVESVINGSVDFLTAHVTNEPIQMDLRGYKTNFISLSGPGGVHLGSAYFCTRKFYERNKDILKRFIRVTSDGWRLAIRSPDKSSDIVIKYASTSSLLYKDVNKSKKKIMSAIKLRHFYLTHKVGFDCICCMSRTYWEMAFDKLKKFKLISDKQKMDKFVRYDVAKAILNRGEMKLQKNKQENY